MPDRRRHVYIDAPPQRARPVALALAMPLLFAVALVACGRKESADGARGGPGGGRGDRPVAVTTTVLQPRAWNDSLQAIGTVKARESVTVTSKVSETVQRVHFDSGDQVRAGTVLVTLNGQAQQAGLSEAQAAADEAERLYTRQNELAARQLIARAAIDTQRAARDGARARVAQVRAQLGDRTIRAPFAGVLGMRQVSPGSLVTPGTPIATLDDIARVYVDFPVPESALAALDIGQPVRGRSVAYPGRDFDGTVTTIDARIDPGSRAVTVRADFPNPDHALRPGMLVDVELQRAQRQALLVPEIAIVQVGQKTFVYRVGTGSRVEQADVATGVRRDGLAEVTRGVQAGDRIVVDGTGKLRPGVTVTEGGKADETPARPASGKRARPGPAG